MFTVLTVAGDCTVHRNRSLKCRNWWNEKFSVGYRYNVRMIRDCTLRCLKIVKRVPVIFFWGYRPSCGKWGMVILEVKKS